VLACSYEMNRATDLFQGNHEIILIGRSD